MTESQEEQLSNTFNKAKVLGAVSGVHNLTPPSIRDDDSMGKVAIIEALRVSPRLQEMFLEVLGLEYDKETKALIQISKPIMNVDGAFRLVKICKRIAEEVEWGFYMEDEIPERIMAFYSENYPHFTLWHKEWDLKQCDFNYVGTVLMAFIDSSFHKAKSAKYINSIARVYNEDFLGRVMKDEKTKKESAVDKFLNALRGGK